MFSMLTAITLTGLLLMCFFPKAVLPFTIYILVLWFGGGIVYFIKTKYFNKKG